MRIRPAEAEMTLRRKRDGTIRVTISAGGTPNGDFVAADCMLVAEGRPHGTTLVAKVIPFSGELTEMTAEDLKERPAHVKIRWNGGTPRVESDFDRECGIGLTFDGEYLRF